MLAPILLAAACQCGAAAPFLTAGPIAQTSEAIYFQPSRGSAVMRVDKASGAQRAVTVPITHAVSAIDFDGTMLFIGTKTSMIAGGLTPIYDGFADNFVASIDASGTQEVIADQLGDVNAIGHDATYVYWMHSNRSVWRRARSGGSAETFATSRTYFSSMVVGADAIWATD